MVPDLVRLLKMPGPRCDWTCLPPTNLTGISKDIVVAFVPPFAADSCPPACDFEQYPTLQKRIASSRFVSLALFRAVAAWSDPAAEYPVFPFYNSSAGSAPGHSQ